MAARLNELKRDPTNYSVRELYALKNEGDPVLNSRTLASIYTKVRSLLSPPPHHTTTALILPFHQAETTTTVPRRDRTH